MGVASSSTIITYDGPPLPSDGCPQLTGEGCRGGLMERWSVSALAVGRVWWNVIVDAAQRKRLRESLKAMTVRDTRMRIMITTVIGTLIKKPSDPR